MWSNNVDAEEPSLWWVAEHRGGMYDLCLYDLTCGWQAFVVVVAFSPEWGGQGKVSDIALQYVLFSILETNLKLIVSAGHTSMTVQHRPTEAHVPEQLT